jgi:hypothetical protein
LSAVARSRRSILAGAEPLSPRRKWRAILLATLLLVPAYWALLAGVVTVASGESGPVVSNPGPYIAFGLAVIPFVFVVLAFLSEHPRAPGAVVRAMALSLLVGIPVSAAAPDAVTGFVAGLGAGGIAALRADPIHDWRARAAAVAGATLFVFLLVMVSDVALLLAPALPFTIIGVADHIVERRKGHGRAERT